LGSIAPLLSNAHPLLNESAFDWSKKTLRESAMSVKPLRVN
jgi:hypothetical protein